MSDNINLTAPQKVTYIVKKKMHIVGDAWGDPEHSAILFAHGGGQTRYAWRKTAMKLAEKGWYSIAIDLRGHGDSSWDSRGDYRLETFAKDLCAIAATFEKPPVLVGASLGGIAGLLAEGESIVPVFDSIILVDIALRYEKIGVDRIFSFMGAQMEKGFANPAEAGEAIAAYIPHRSKKTDSKGLEKYLRIGPDGRYYWHWDPKFLACNNNPKINRSFKRFAAAARSLRIPTLLVRGHMSDVISEEAAIEFLELAPHAKFVDVKGAGHMVAGDRNDIFSDAVIQFLTVDNSFTNFESKSRSFEMNFSSICHRA